jgi:hypothetical protein
MLTSLSIIAQLLHNFQKPVAPLSAIEIAATQTKSAYADY